MHKWKSNMGMEVLKCPKCGKTYTSRDEYSFEEDMCMYCLYPQTSPNMPAEISREYGDPINKTNQAKMLDNLQNIPEKQSKAAQEAYRKYKEKTYLRGSRSRGKVYKGD